MDRTRGYELRNESSILSQSTIKLVDFLIKIYYNYYCIIKQWKFVREVELAGLENR